MNEYYFAPVYDFLLHPFVNHLRQKVVQTAQKYQAESILDMCCGTGHQLKYFSKAGISAEGVDLNKLMIKQASGTNCRYGDARATAYPDEHFDMAMTTLALHEMPVNNARAIIHEMIRITRKEGRLMLIDYDFGPHSSSFMKTALKAVEYFVGGDHYRNFRHYISSGQMNMLSNGMPLQLEETHYFFRRTVSMKIYKKTDIK